MSTGEKVCGNGIGTSILRNCCRAVIFDVTHSAVYRAGNCCGMLVAIIGEWSTTGGDNWY